MEVSLLSSLIIKSSIRDYEVFFSQSVFDTLKNELKSGDVIFIDKKVFKYLPEDVQQLIMSGKHILIDATEGEKSYTALTPIIEQLIENHVNRALLQLKSLPQGIARNLMEEVAKRSRSRYK